LKILSGVLPVKRLALVAVVLVLTGLAARFSSALHPAAAADTVPSGGCDGRVQACSAVEGDELAAIQRLFDEASDLNHQGRFEEADGRYLEAARASGELLYAKASYERGNAVLARIKGGDAEERGLLLKAEQQFRDCLAREAHAARGPKLFDGARGNLERVRARLTASAAPAATAKPRLGEAKSIGQTTTPPAAAKTRNASESTPVAQARSSEGLRPPVVTEAPKARRAAPAPLMVGPDGVIYQPLRAEPETRR
jgi:hypothetical protein